MINAKQDGNVTFIGPRARYSVIGVQPTLLVHTMASGSLDGLLPATASKDYTQLDPVVTGGNAAWSGLLHGGLFNFSGKALVIEALSSGTWLIVKETVPNTYTTARPTPSAVPFRLAPNEKLQVSGVASASVLVRQDIQKCI